MNGDDEKLDRLLSAPFATIADDGFSARVMTKIRRDAPASWLEPALLAVAACMILAVLSAAGFPEWVEGLSISLATSLPLATAAFALALTLLYVRVVPD